MSDVSWGHGQVADAATPIDPLDPVRTAITPSGSQIGVGDDLQLTATAYYRDGSTRDVSSLGQWSSDDEAVAVVSMGIVEAIASGEVSVSFFYGTSSDRTSIQVQSVSPVGDDDWWFVVA